jgi:hypothetical protein
MSYTAKVFNVMIASPGDVASERAIIREVLYEWNSVHSKSRNIVLLPIGWESHSSPEMGSSPQSIINEQILDKCDFLVGVFWTRIGTATDKYASGSVEEIEKHIELKKPVMLYFSGQPVAMDTVNLDQIKELKTFKDSCKSRGLYEEYDSLSDFKEKFYRHLQLKLNEHPLFKDIEADGIGEVVESKTHIPSLTKESRTLLKEASLDSHGTIMSLRMLGGNAIQTNGKNFITSNNRREEALWEAAIQELVENDLIYDPGHKGEVFQLTNLGYQTADMIEI